MSITASHIREVKIEYSLVRDPTDGPGLCRSIVWHPVTVDRRPVVDTADDAGKVLLVCALACKTHFPILWCDGSNDVEDFGEDIDADFSAQNCMQTVQLADC